MSLPNRPAYQKPTKSSSSSSSSSSSAAGGGGGGAPGARWNGIYSAGVSPVRGLSPVRSTFHGAVARQDMEMGRSHTNPLFNSRTSDIGRGGVHTTPTKACKECKENREKLQEPWKVPTDKAQYSGKTLNSSTPTGKSTRTTANMRFTTPPKPVVKRKILAENREFVTTTCPPTRMKEEEIKPQVVAAAPPPPAPRKEVIAGAEPTIVGAVSRSRNDEGQSRAESDGLSSSAALSPERSITTTGEDSSKPKSPLVSIEELQKRIQKFLQDEGGSSAAAAADVSVPMMLCTPRQSTESLRMSPSGTSFAAACGEESSSSLTGVVDEAPFQPVVAPYSPRPEFLRARKSPSMEGAVVSPLRGEADTLIQEKTTTPSNTYDPKNNFLSPRPQFLRYRPLRRLELLRKSAEGTLGDFDPESPATDADSSRMGSEKDVDEKEVDESESQEVSQQEVQTLKSSSSLESPPPRCKVSHELFKSAAAVEEENVEIIQLKSGEEPQQQLQSSISCTKPPPDADTAAGSDVPSTDSKFDLLEEDDEDSDNNSSSAWYYNACGIVTVFAFVALLVVASGSPALLPTSLHQSHVSHLWKTSRATEPIRLFLQTTEGLWAENSHVRDFSLSSPDIVRVGCVHVSSLIQSHVDLSKVVKIGKVVWSSCMAYSTRLGRLMKESYANLKASLEGEMDFYSSRNGQEEVNEWDWVPDYEFVVPHDMFDPVEAYENIMARMESWEVKSLWMSLVKSYSRHPSSQQIVEEPLHSSIEGRNASLCSLSSATPAEDDVILSFRLAAAALARVVAEIPISKPSQDIEPNANIAEQSEEENTPQELDAVLSAQNDDQELEVGGIVVTELSSTTDAGIAAENAAGVVVEDESFSSPTEGEFPLAHGVERVQLSDVAAEEVQLVARVAEDDPKFLEPVWIQEDQPVPFQESLQGDSGAEVVSLASSREENDADSSMPLATKPVTPPRSLFLEELVMHAPGFRTIATIFTSLLLAAGVALLVFHKMYTRSGNSRTAANLTASEAEPRFSKSSVEPQFKEANEFYPIEGSPGSEDPFLAEDPSLEVHLSFDQVRQFSTPYPVTGGTPDQLLGKGMGKDALEKSLKNVTDVGDTFQTQDMESPEKSSLGLFTTMVPVVLNEGTARERVQLTPVRRSSRIRTRMQNSPCHLTHSPHVCDC